MIPYKGYIEANRTIPDLPQYNEDVLCLVISDHKYGERAPVQIGTQVIDYLVVIMNETELQQDRETWKQVHLNTVISQRNTMKGLNTPKYDLKGVKGKIHTKREVIILPFGTTVVKGSTNLMTHSKCLNVAVEPVIGYLEHNAMARWHGVLKPGRGKIGCLPLESQCKADNPPIADYCGRDCSSQHHPGSLGTKAKRAQDS